MKKTAIVSFALALAMAFGAVSAETAASKEEATIDLSELYKDKDVETDWDESEAEYINLSELEGESYTISEKGTYVLSGSYAGQVVIDAEDAKVRLVLNGAQISCDKGPAIYEKSSDKLIITLAEGSENMVVGSGSMSVDEDEISAAIYCADDLSINGSGSLNVSSLDKHGIFTRGDLIIAGGNYVVSAKSDAIRGRNSVLILSGSFDITSDGDGIVSTRSTKDGKGWVTIAGGTFNITTGDGAGEVKQTTMGFGNMHGGWDRDYSSSVTTTSTSQKGIKAATNLTILDGSFTLDCADDSIHSNGDVTINGGSFDIKTGDDAVHADNLTTINGGNIDIKQCYEGLEGKDVTVNGGEISIVCSDDGINASGSDDAVSSYTWGMGGEADNGAKLIINGGSLSVTAGGDALDSNGSIYLNGGVVRLWAATSGGEGAVDFNGSCTVTGCALIVASTGGVMSDTSQITGCPLMSVSVNGAAGSEIKVTDASGNVLVSYSPIKAYDTVMIAIGALSEGDQCEMTIDGSSVYSGEVSTNVSPTSMFGFGGRGGFGGMGGNQQGGKRR